eukprot:3424787-Prymnesium_polylepis.1
MPILDAVGRLLVRFPSAGLQIHAHTGPNAPATYAPLFTRERAQMVACRLKLDHRIASERLTTRGWGKAVCLHARWPAGRESARGELF